MGNPQPEPPLPPKPTLPNNEIKIQALGESGGLNINYDIRISWNFISEGGEHNGWQGQGPKNDVWLEYRGKTTLQNPTYVEFTNYMGLAAGFYIASIANNTIEEK